MSAVVEQNTCTGYSACVDICPVEAIEMQNGKAVIDAEKCTDCGACVGECPVEAISM